MACKKVPGETWIENLEDSFSSDWLPRGMPLMTLILCQDISRHWGRLHNPEQAMEADISSKITYWLTELSQALRLPFLASKDSLRIW